MLHSKEHYQKIFAQYRDQLQVLEREKAQLDTEFGLRLESVTNDGRIQCEIVENREGVIVTYYRIDPANLVSPSVEPDRIKNAFYDRDLYYTPEEIAAMEAEEEEDDDSSAGPSGVQQQEGDIITLEHQPQGVKPGLVPPTYAQEPQG